MNFGKWALAPIMPHGSHSGKPMQSVTALRRSRLFFRKAE
jgi:hypothetical protein